MKIKHEERLEGVHHLLDEVVREVANIVPVVVLCGHRGEAEQNRLEDEGKSQVRYPNGKHNSIPSGAVDLMPMSDTIKSTEDFNRVMNDRETLTYFAGIVRGVAHSIGINIRWGGDWNSNFDLKDNKFDDLFHFELV
jgi:peptidoglycan L-alanyl-D-glutamate endopeptidase CwlK